MAKSDVVDSYVGMTHNEIFQRWSHKPNVAGEYSPAEIERIHRKWRSLGKRIAAGSRIPDGPLSGGNKRRTGA